MRACQNVAMYCQHPGQERKKQMKAHKQRMKGIKGVLTNNDLKFENPHSPRNNQDSSKISAMRYGNDALIARNNLVLAKRIFEIMEGPGIISDLLESDPTTKHPGTINFPHRLAEAKRIHNENLIIASRLDAVQPTYYDKSAITAVRKCSPMKGKRPQPSRPAAQQGHGHAPGQQPGQGGHGPGRGTGLQGGSELAQHSSVVDGSRSEDKPPKSKNVLLEYTKIQKGRVLDVAVIKEPFRDSYSIFGIDIDNGQRYELKLSSEEVSTALEGDILVTSVDNVEVWMALISKVELVPVEAFSKTPLPNASHVHNSHSESKKPTKPTSLNSSKNQNNNNPRKNKLLKKGDRPNVAPASRGRVNTAGGSSVGSSSAVNNGTVDDDYSLTTGGDISQRHNLDDDTDHDHDLNFEEEDGEGEAEGGYTLDEYYENNAPLSPLPSQTGFVTSAPSGRQRVASEREESSGSKGHVNSTPTSGISSGGDKNTFSGSDLPEKDDDDEGPGNEGSTVETAVKYVVDTAIKNVLMLHVSAQPVQKGGEDRSAREKQKASEKNSGPAKSSHAHPPTSNPYTSTTVTVSASPRSRSIMYKQVAPAGGGGGSGHKEKAAVGGGEAGGGGGGGAGGDKGRPPTTPGGSKDKDKTVSEPKEPTESAPTGYRRPSKRPVLDTGNNSKRKPSHAANNHNAHTHSDDHGRKKSKAVASEGAGAGYRKMSSFRKPVDPMEAITALVPKVAELGVKTAIKRVMGIVELFDIDVS